MTCQQRHSSKMMRMGQRNVLLAMLPILWLAFGLGARGLNADVIWLDELYSLSNMGAFDGPYSPAQIIDSLFKYSPDQVPFFYWLAAVWAALVGWSPFALRLFSTLAGALMIAWLYRFAADAVNRRTAVLAALLMSSTAFVVIFFHELRMYSLLMLLAVMHSWLYWRLARGFQVGRLTWLVFILTAALLIYTHGLAIILFAGLGLHHLLLVSRSRRWLHIALGWGLGALLFLPYARVAVKGLRWMMSNEQVTPTAEILGASAHLLVNGWDVLWLPLLLAFGYALWHRRNLAILRLLMIAFIMVLGLCFANWQFEMLQLHRMRYVLVLWFPFVILFAWGLTSLPRWPAAAAVFVLLWSIAGWRLNHAAEFLDYVGQEVAVVQAYPPLHEYAARLKHQVKSTDYLVGFTDASQVYKVRKHGWSIADYYLKFRLGIDGMLILTSRGGAELENDVREALDEQPSILFAYNPQDKPPNVEPLRRIIHEDHIPCAVLADDEDLLAQRYVSRVLGCHHQFSAIAPGS